MKIVRSIPKILVPLLATVLLSVAGRAGAAPASAEADARFAPFVEALRLGIEKAKRDGAGDPNDEADQFRYVLQQAFEGYRIYFETDPDFPEWVEGSQYPRGNGGNSPDTTYYYTRVNPAATYRIWGKRNTIAFAVMQVGTMGDVSIVGGKPLAHIYLDDLKIGSDGSFEMILSPERPAGYQGDWRKMDPRAEIIYLRQVMLDWDKETEAQVFIERVDRPLLPPRPSAADLRARELAMYEYTMKTVRRSIETAVKPPPVNDLAATRFSETGGLANQLYQWGRFDIAEGEALLVEGVSPAACRFWNFEVTDTTLSANDYVYRQTHLNKRLLAVDGDGKWRLIVSLTDPGVANWVDTAGHRRGTMMMRWESCPQETLATLRKVRLDDLKRELPADTRWVTTAQREQALRERASALRKRLRR